MENFEEAVSAYHNEVDGADPQFYYPIQTETLEQNPAQENETINEEKPFHYSETESKMELPLIEEKKNEAKIQTLEINPSALTVQTGQTIDSATTAGTGIGFNYQSYIDVTPTIESNLYTELLSEKKTTPLIDQNEEYTTNNIQEIKQENSPSKEYEGSSNLAEEMRQYLASLDEKLKNSSTNLWEPKPLQYSQVMASQENKGIEVSETITTPYQDPYTSPYKYQLDYSSKPIETNVSTYVMGDTLGYTVPASYQPLSEDLAEDKKSVFPTDNIIGTQYTYTDYYKPSEAPLNIGEYNTQTNPIVQTDYKITTDIELPKSSYDYQPYNSGNIDWNFSYESPYLKTSSYSPEKAFTSSNEFLKSPTIWESREFYGIANSDLLQNSTTKMESLSKTIEHMDSIIEDIKQRHDNITRRCASALGTPVKTIEITPPRAEQEKKSRSINRALFQDDAQGTKKVEHLSIKIFIGVIVSILLFTLFSQIANLTEDDEY